MGHERGGWEGFGQPAVETICLTVHLHYWLTSLKWEEPGLRSHSLERPWNPAIPSNAKKCVSFYIYHKMCLFPNHVIQKATPSYLSSTHQNQNPERNGFSSHSVLDKFVLGNDEDEENFQVIWKRHFQVVFSVSMVSWITAPPNISAF